MYNENQLKNTFFKSYQHKQLREQVKSILRNLFRACKISWEFKNYIFCITVRKELLQINLIYKTLSTMSSVKVI